MQFQVEINIKSEQDKIKRPYMYVLSAICDWFVNYLIKRVRRRL